MSEEEDTSEKYQCPRKVAKTVYFTHLVLSALFTTYILFTHPQVVTPSITFVMLMIYGYMLAWVLVLNFLFILCRKQGTAVCINRILVKLIILVFPLFGLLSISQNPYLQIWQIHAFIIYMTAITFILLVYEIVVCCFLDKKYPSYVFGQNDVVAQNEVKGGKKVNDDTHSRSI